MTDGSDARRPHGREHDPAPDDQEHTDQQHGSQDRGGDAEAAGSVEERERIATDDDDTWEGRSPRS